MISWWNKRFSANNLILLTSAFGLGHKILLPQFTTFTGNNDLFLSALRASRNKRIIFCFKSFISSLDHYDLRIIIIRKKDILKSGYSCLCIYTSKAYMSENWNVFRFHQSTYNPRCITNRTWHSDTNDIIGYLLKYFPILNTVQFKRT